MKCEEVRKRMQQINVELEKISLMELKFPKGELICTKNGTRYKWYVKDKGGTIYLPKSKRRMAEKLAYKKYIGCRKQELECELSACSVYLQRVISTEGKSDQMRLHPEYRKLLGKYCFPLDEELRKWQSDRYERCKKHEDALVIKGTQGKMLRSKSEAIIDMMLYKNGIPFRYEEKLILNGITIYPDFVIRHPKTGEYYYWEHFGMMDEEEYRNHACEKIKLYCDNGIIPSINLIATYETKDHPLSIEQVEKIITEYFLV